MYLIKKEELSVLEGFKDETVQAHKEERKVFKRQIVWFNALGFLALHIVAVYGLYLVVTSAKLLTTIWKIFLMFVAGEGVTLGAHRLYTHRALKATLPLRIILVLLQTIAGQNCLYIWVRDHRQHHKYSDTDADPHNSKRGFFFSHMGWLMCRKHPDVIEKGKTIDLSDLEADPIVMFQKKYYKTLYTVFAIAMPTLVPYYLWNETLWNGFFIAFITRAIVSLNMTWLVNSAAHKYGTRPYSKDIVPVESVLVSMAALGEGWHNYHHTFPWDYRAAEYGQSINITTTVIDFLAKYGWFYDLKSATPEMVARRIFNSGDGTHPRIKTKIQVEENKKSELRSTSFVDDNTEDDHVDNTENEEQKKLPQKILNNGHKQTEFIESVYNDKTFENFYIDDNLRKPMKMHGS